MKQIASPRLQKLASDVARERALALFWDEMEAVGTPLIEAVPDSASECYVTFLYRKSSEGCNIAVVGGPVEDLDGRMALLEGTDVFYKTYRLRNDARFTYMFSVSDTFLSIKEAYQAQLAGNPELMERLEKTLRADPLNKYPITDDESSGQTSSIALPRAPGQPYIKRRSGAAAGSLIQHRIKSAALNNERDIWVYLPPGYTADDEAYPVAVFLDGQLYNSQAPTPVILDNLLAEGLIPPLAAVMVSSIDYDVRMTELDCNPDFLQFVTDDVLGMVRQAYRITTNPDRTIICGVSMGGLAAAYFGLCRSDVYGNVLSQSGSFHRAFPGDDGGFEGMMRAYDRAERLPLRFYLEAGLMERAAWFDDPTITLLDCNRRFRDVLKAKGYDVQYAEFNGEHSFESWRGSLSDGLLALVSRWG